MAQLGLAGRRVFALSGELDSFYYPEDVLALDPAVREAFEALRASKASGAGPGAAERTRQRTVLRLLQETREAPALWHQNIHPQRPRV